MSVYEIREIEMGFLTGAGHNVKLAEQFRLVRVDGLPVKQVQFWRLGVYEPGKGEREHLMLICHYPAVPAEIRTAIAAIVQPLYPQAVLSFSLEDAEGKSVISAESRAAEAAAAMAEVKRRGGWDESPTFHIAVGADAFAVSLRWRTDRIEAHVRECRLTTGWS
jgi:hypothetical protein